MRVLTTGVLGGAAVVFAVLMLSGCSNPTAPGCVESFKDSTFGNPTFADPCGTVAHDAKVPATIKVNR